MIPKTLFTLLLVCFSICLSAQAANEESIPSPELSADALDYLIESSRAADL